MFQKIKNIFGIIIGVICGLFVGGLFTNRIGLLGNGNKQPPTKPDFSGIRDEVGELVETNTKLKDGIGLAGDTASDIAALSKRGRRLAKRNGEILSKEKYK